MVAAAKQEQVVISVGRRHPPSAGCSEFLLLLPLMTRLRWVLSPLAQVLMASARFFHYFRQNTPWISTGPCARSVELVQLIAGFRKRQARSQRFPAKNHPGTRAYDVKRSDGSASKSVRFGLDPQAPRQAEMARATPCCRITGQNPLFRLMSAGAAQMGGNF